jgi:PAS domain S-box-containing protein
MSDDRDRPDPVDGRDSDGDDGHDCGGSRSTAVTSAVERLHGTAQRLVRAPGPQEVAWELVRAAREVLGYGAAAVWVVRGDGDRFGPVDGSPPADDDRRLVPLASAGVDPDAVDPVDDDRRGNGEGGGGDAAGAFGPESRLWHLFREGEPARVDDRWFGTEGAFLVPVGDYGLLGVGDADGRLADRDTDLLSILAADAEVALEGAARRAALREERDRLAALFEHAGDPIVEVTFEDGAPLVRRVNDAFEATFGYDEESIVGEDLDELLVPDGELAAARELTAAGRRGADIDRRVTRVAADGPREFRLRGATFEDGDGRVTGFATYVDVTEHARYARALGRLHETARELMRADDADEVAAVAANAMADVLGYPACGVRLYDDDRDVLELAAASATTFDLLGGRPDYGPGDGIVWEVYVDGESRIVDDVDAVDDGQSRAGIASAMYLPVGDHGTLSLGATSPARFDEVDRRLAEVLATTVEVALDRTNRTTVLRRRERELARQNERLEEFATVVSHDLRNPLSIAQGYTGLARDAVEAGDAATAADYFERVERAHERMDDLIGDVLSLAREGQRVGETERVDLGDAARESWAAVDTRDACLTVDDDRPVAADPDRLASLLENLFRNAVEHGGDAVRVTVGATDEGFYVADDGPGIPADERDRVFERGYSTGDTGTGFGLSIVREIVEAHGWSVAVGEADAGGARIDVRGVGREASS